MKGIFRIIFNKWVMYTHHQIKFKVQPKEMGAQKMLSAINSLLKNAKMQALTKIHLYELCIEKNDKTTFRESNVNKKLQNNNLALFMIKNLMTPPNLHKLLLL